MGQEMVKRAPDHQRTDYNSVVYNSVNQIMANRHNEIERNAIRAEAEANYFREVFFVATGYALASRLRAAGGTLEA